MENKQIKVALFNPDEYELKEIKMSEILRGFSI